MSRSPSLPVHRLSARQMAFVRSWAEGLDVVASWNRYLPAEGPADARRAHGELQRLLDDLRSLARAKGRQDIAALLLRDPEAMVERPSAGLTLAEFAAQQPEDYYSEAELLELFQEQHGRPDARSAGRRRQRLRQRLGDALAWLAQTPVRPPAPEDALDAWLDARVVARLRAAGLHTLGDLLHWIEQHGARWHRAIARLGPVGAQRIVQWLQDQEASLGPLPLGRGSQSPTATPTAGIAPLERFIPPAHPKRGPELSCRISASTDIEAVAAWVGLKPAGSHTARAYRKEAERFVLWVTLVRERSLATLQAEDVRAYEAFLLTPPPEWTAPRHTPRASAAWRPFEGALSPRSARTAIIIVRGLCTWLTRMRYLAANPWDEVGIGTAAGAATRSSPAAGSSDHQTGRRTGTEATVGAAAQVGFSPDEWKRIEAWLDSLNADLASARLAFLMRFGVATGLQLSEWARARLDWVSLASTATGQAQWQLSVPETGSAPTGPLRRLALDEQAVAGLRRWLRARGLSADVFANPPQLPLASRLDGERTLAPARIYEVLSDGFSRCAVAVHPSDPALAERLSAASARWLRHTYGRALARTQPAPETFRERLGHRTAWSALRYLRADPRS